MGKWSRIPRVIALECTFHLSILNISIEIKVRNINALTLLDIRTMND